MILTVFTRRVDYNDSRIGFFHAWLCRLAERVDFLYIVCLEVGAYDLPDNTEVICLGKGKLRRSLRFLWKNPIRRSDAVFCHQCPIYTVMSWPFAKLYRKPLLMWHTHGSTSNTLWVASKMADKILSATRDSFPWETNKKLVVTGHGIDTDLFRPSDKRGDYLLYVGRISPIKKLEKILGTPHKKVVIGEATDSDYLIKVKNKAQNTTWLGSLPHYALLEHIQKCSVFISASNTGSLDKACLEAMACGKPIMTSNTAVRNILRKYEPQLSFMGLADFEQKIDDLLNMCEKEREEMGSYLRRIVLEDHNLDKLCNKIIKEAKKGDEGK